MSEEKTKSVNPKEFREGFFIEMDCGMCQTEAVFAAPTKKELSQKIKEAGWKDLESEQYQMVCYWCGCDYVD